MISYQDLLDNSNEKFLGVEFTYCWMKDGIPTPTKNYIGHNKRGITKGIITDITFHAQGASSYFLIQFFNEKGEKHVILLPNPDTNIVKFCLKTVMIE